MEFAKKYNDGHMGPRKFYRECLPRLKYWNPSVAMIVNRTADNSGPATMTLYFRQPSPTSAPSKPINSKQQPSSSMEGASPAAAPLEDERTVTIDMKAQRSEEILESFLKHTGAKVLETPLADVEAMQVIEERRLRSEADAIEGAKRRAILAREEELLEKARAEAAEAKAAD